MWEAKREESQKNPSSAICEANKDRRQGVGIEGEGKNISKGEKSSDLDSLGRDFASLLSVEDAIFDLGADLQLFRLALEVAEVEEDLLLVGQRLDEPEAENGAKIFGLAQTAT